MALTDLKSSDVAPAAAPRTPTRSATPRPGISVSKQFRPEIEGVRFVAALLVACYHIWSGRVSGGVDVFFVMSGFLITTTLLGQINSFGRIKPLTYLSRLALRLLPAALAVLTTVLVASFFLMPELVWEKIGHEIRAAGLYFENWFLAATSTDYLGQWDEKTPVQHFWALSLQGQLYVTWLLLFLVLAAMIKRRPERALQYVVGGLSLIFVTSLAFSVWFTGENQPVAYFATPARGWEFALGGLAAIALRHPPQNRSRLRWSLGWVGLGVLLTTGLVLQVSTVFPGYAALLPTGAALLILLSARNGISGGADSLLSTKTLVWLGGISYGVYLWHYPLLKFYRSERDTEASSIASGVAIILTAVLLAYLTQRFVEKPLLAFSRRSPQARRAAVTALVIAALAVVVGSSVFADAKKSSPESIAQVQKVIADLSARAYALEPCTGALAGPPSSTGPCGDHTVEEFVAPLNLIPATQQAIPCNRVVQDGHLLVCSGGDPSVEPRATALLIGDSHSLTMRPALDLVAQHNGWRLLFAYGPGCQTAAVAKAGDTAERCAAWMEQLTDYINDTEIDVLFNIQAARDDFVGIPEGVPERIADAYSTQWARYDSSVKQVVVIRDTPRLSDTLLTCLGRHSVEDAGQECSRARSTALKPDYAALAAAGDDDARTQVVDLSDVFCDEDRCYPVLGDFIAYRDAVHLHTGFAPTLTPLLDEAIQDAVTPEMRDLLFQPAL
jgi:peptidoglycan/LPS O-acetylase OafA/YrhL